MGPSRAWIGSLAVLIAAACFNRVPERPPIRPLTTGELEMGYQEAVELGSRYVTEGYPGAELQRAEQVLPNLWRVRFGLPPKDSGRILDLYFDESRRLIKKEELTDKEGRPSASDGGRFTPPR